MPVSFHFEIPVFPIERKKIRAWIITSIKSYGFKCDNISIIFISKNRITELNKTYLKHNYSTDVITFNYNDKFTINGDIFICIDQVKDNSKSYNTTFTDELLRVIIHGVLHLIGFNDKSVKERNIMQFEEDKCLNFFRTL